MNLGKIVKNPLRKSGTSSEHRVTKPKPKHRSEMDIFFTKQFYSKADACGLTEEHARFVFLEGEIVKQQGKPTNMKIATYKGQEIGIYVFPDEQTAQPVITSIWKRQPRGAK